MARFRRGNLILNQDQQISIGDIDITYDGNTIEVNKSVKSQGLKIGSGEEVTSVSNSPSSDSTAELMTSYATQQAINAAVAGYSGGINQLEAILQPRPELVASKLITGSQDYYSGASISSSVFRDVNLTSYGVTALKSGLIAFATRNLADPGMTIDYITEDGTQVGTIGVLTQYSGVTIATETTSKEMTSTSSGKLTSIFYANTGSNTRYLVAVDEKCQNKIEMALPYTNTQHSYGMLPNDEIVVYAYNGDTYSLARYTVDFDSSSFIAVQEFTEVTGLLDGLGSPSSGPTIKFIGENKIAVPNGSGVQIIDLETNTYLSESQFTISSTPYVEVSTDKKLVMIGRRVGSAIIYGKVIDFNCNEIIAETTLVTAADFNTGYPSLRTLPSGDIIVVFPGVGNYVKYIIIDTMLNILYQGTTTLYTSTNYGTVDVLPNGKLLISNTVYPTFNILTLGGPAVSGMSFSDDTYFSGVSTDTWVEDNKVVSTDTIVDRIGSYNNKISPRSKMPYHPGNGIFGEDSYYEYSAPLLSTNVGNLCASTSYYYTAVIMNKDGNLVVMYQTASQALYGTVLDGDTFEILSTNAINVPSGMSSTLLAYCGALLTNSGAAISVFSTGNTPAYPSILVGVRSDGTIVQPVQSTNLINGICVLDNDDIFVVRYNNSESQYARYRIEDDSTAFVVVQDWTNFTTTYVEFGGGVSGETRMITPLDNNKLLVSGGLSRSFIIDLKGEGYSIEHSSFGWSGYLECFDDKIVGVGTLSSIPSAIVLDKQLNLVKSTELDYTVSTGKCGPEILPNGDIVYTYGADSRVQVVIFKSNGDIQQINTDIVSIANPQNPNICILNDGSFMIIDYDSTLRLYALIFKKAEKLIKKPQILESKTSENRGTYNYKTTKYIPKQIYENAGHISGVRSLCFLNNGKLVVLDSVTAGSYNHPFLVVFDKNDNILIDRQALDFSELEGAGATISVNQRSIYPFNNKPWFACVLTNGTTWYYGLHIYDENGDRVCYPHIIPKYMSFRILDDDTIALFESYTTGTSPYNQGLKIYYSRFAVDSDSSSIIFIETPKATYAGNANMEELNSRSWLYTESATLYVADKISGTSKARYTSFLGELSGANLGIINILDEKTFTVTVWDGSLNSFISFWEWDEKNHEISFTGREYDLGIVGGNSFKLQTFPDGNGNVLLLELSGYDLGIRIIDKNGNYLQDSDYIYPGPSPTQTYSQNQMIPSLSGELADVGHIAGTTYVRKWKPVNKMNSPLVSTIDVNYLIDETSSTITLTSNHLGQLIVNADSTAQIINIPSDSNEDLPLGFKCTIARLSTGDITVTADGGVTIVSIGNNVSLSAQGSTAVLTKIEADTWQLSGDLD